MSTRRLSAVGILGVAISTWTCGNGESSTSCSEAFNGMYAGGCRVTVTPSGMPPVTYLSEDLIQRCELEAEKTAECDCRQERAALLDCLSGMNSTDCAACEALHSTYTDCLASCGSTGACDPTCTPGHECLLGYCVDPST